MVINLGLPDVVSGSDFPCKAEILNFYSKLYMRPLVTRLLSWSGIVVSDQRMYGATLSAIILNSSFVKGSWWRSLAQRSDVGGASAVAAGKKMWRTDDNPSCLYL